LRSAFSAPNAIFENSAFKGLIQTHKNGKARSVFSTAHAHRPPFLMASRYALCFQSVQKSAMEYTAFSVRYELGDGRTGSEILGYVLSVQKRFPKHKGSL
jgi:hypothetical protein